ncbi:GNAT family N-acetyltransferase [Actinotalea ferrariae]|uniref:GNAT family N-acetyltransferase n=1 Tax=Actinotalea ferrariae TaxID=1386098 RepID=UPI001C8CBE7A|nr:GNAT family protein [Actinotalea ferrariae]MBX9246107.1 GNAT family N-acetyltransferase [Actinotalea ferrariae]
MEPLDLRDDRLLLSPPTEADLDDITEACQDPQIAAWVTIPAPYARSDGEGFLRQAVVPGWASGSSLTWAVREADDDDGRLLAMIGLDGIGDGSAELGFWVAPWARRRGVMTRATALVLQHAFAPDGLGLERVLWQAYVGNWPSRRVAWRAGFRVEGTVRLHGVQRGVRRDMWVGTLLRGDPREPVEPWPAD